MSEGLTAKREVTTEIRDDTAQAESVDEGRISVIVVDDHPMLRERLVSALEADERLECVGEAGDGRQALEELRMRKPDVVILDIFMPEMDGTETLRVIREEGLDVKVLVLTAYPVAGLHDALEYRPDSLLFKQEPCTRVCDEVVALVRGEEHSPGQEALRQATALAYSRVKLTPREQIVLELAPSRRPSPAASRWIAAATPAFLPRFSEVPPAPLPATAPA